MIALLCLLVGTSAAQETRFLNASADAGLLEAYAGGTLVAGGVDYLEASGATPVATGLQVVEAAAAGGGGYPVLASNLVDFQAGVRTDLVAYGPVDSMGLLPINQQGTNINPAANRWQFAHLSTGTPDVDIYLPDTDTLASDDLPYGANDSIDVPATGPFQIMVDIDDDEGADWIFTMPDPGAGNLYNMLLVGEGEELSFVVWDEAGGINVVDGLYIPKPTVRFLHLSPDMPPTDVYIGFSFDPTFTNIAFTERSEPVAIKRGTTGFTLAEAGLGPTSPLGEGSARLQAETDYAVFVFGSVNNPLYLHVKDPVDLPPDTLTLRLVHTSLDMGPVQVFRDGALVDELKRGQYHKGQYGAGAFELAFDNTLDGIAEWTFQVPDYGTAFINAFLVKHDPYTTKLHIEEPSGSMLILDPL